MHLGSLRALYSWEQESPRQQVSLRKLVIESTMKNWPSDVDGDVLRRLEESGLDFSQPTLIDFNVDFERWPPPEQAVDVLAQKYPNLEINEPDPENDFPGDITFKMYERLTYEMVIRVQTEVTELMAPFGGLCECWGVFSEPPRH